ncbi:hypothetical protein [Clostridium grantii]|uniref:Uncharacterized protein n=1 Tax=Clostridium grantii DSM 8605 TaxID=1121316 RepID=A0A1M5Y1S3_9CLOT|nr:hypothetical protein [Clostridium grantii]SHI05997.1 hypothetical protein SAMN02745207_04126 [Clostridium grantii DSM 8605]
MIHNLYEDYTHKRPAAFELRGKKIDVKDWKEMLIETGNLLFDIDEKIISSFPYNSKMNGKKVVYFSFEREPSMRSPRKLKDLDLYIATNHSAKHIRNIISNMIKQYKISISDFKIYLKADYSELH